ncbi:hypothetical protein MLD38_010836 [Melastoma candidum]|uniref:Uncharacterized protein n=1 Tax=Melastoma candidum TaxID=119954 RepID=A0ACB9R0M6_9MYRT|nr:hypothetical protein MLD38_010836 [Melastoma candidum]
MAGCDVSSIHKDENMQILDDRVASAADTTLVCMDSQDKRDFSSKKGAKSVGRAPADDDLVLSASDARSVCSEAPGRTLAAPKRLGVILPRKSMGSPKGLNQKPSPLSPRSRTLKTTPNKKSDASMVSPLKGSRETQ